MIKKVQCWDISFATKKCYKSEKDAIFLAGMPSRALVDLIETCGEMRKDI